MTKIRVGDLAEITGTTKDAIQNYHRDDNVPWYDDFTGEGHRRYGGHEALCLILNEILRAQGCSVTLAAAFVRDQSRLVAEFLDEVEAGRARKPRFILGLRMATEDSLFGLRWESLHHGGGDGSLDSVLDIVRAQALRVGTEWGTRKDRDGNPQTIERTIGGPWVAMAEIGEAYRLLQLRARQTGFVVDGRSILKLATEE